MRYHGEPAARSNCGLETGNKVCWGVIQRPLGVICSLDNIYCAGISLTSTTETVKVIFCIDIRVNHRCPICLSTSKPMQITLFYPSTCPVYDQKMTNETEVSRLMGDVMTLL